MRNFLKTKLDKIKNSFKKPSKKTFGKIGLFLTFGLFILNINFYSGKIFIANADFSDSVKNAFISVASVAVPGGSAIAGVYNSLDAVGISPVDGILWVFNWLLYSVIVAISKLLVLAGMLLDFSLEKDYLRQLVESEEIYKLWAVVRDVLNLFFMLLLLFSAFSTIFQVEKYHLRKTIIMLVVMALLVNFSYPISLFIIDFSNSAMGFILDAAFGNSSASESAGLSSVVGFGDVLKKYYDGKSFFSDTITAQLIVSVILIFIYFITIISLAINLLIRMFAFIVLVILSPFGFVFAFFPGTSKLSSEWWDKMLNYAFMGPVMAFFILITVTLFKNDSTIGGGNVAKVDDAVYIAMHIVAVIFLWLGLIFSNKMGGDASNIAMGIAKKTGNTIQSYGKKAAWGTAGMVGTGVARGTDAAFGHRISGGVGGLKAKWDSWGENYKSKSNTRKTQAADFLGVSGANEKLVQEVRKGWKEKGGVDDDEMKKIDKGGTRAERIALALERSENKGFDSDPGNAFTQYQEGLKAIGNDKVYKDLFVSNARKKNVDLVVRQRIETENASSIKNGTGPITQGQRIKHAEEEFSKLSPTQWKDQNIKRLVDTTVTHSADILDAAKATVKGRPAGPGGVMVGGYSAKAKENLANDMDNIKYAHGQGAGLWI